MKNLVFWFLALVAAGVLTWQITRARDTERLIDAAVTMQIHAYAHAGRTLIWPETLEKVGPDSGDSAYLGPRLVLAFSETSCDLCRDAETAFAVGLADAISAEILAIVIHAGHPRYVAAYKKRNGFDHPVLFDREGRFFEQNQILDSPIMFLVDEKDRVLAAHVPQTDHLDLCVPFHHRIEAFFGADATHGATVDPGASATGH